jgi:hypothetical protein
MARPVSAEPGGRPISATRAGIHEGRVIFRPDVDLWVYRSYPLSISLRPGPALESHRAAWHIRGIFVEPYDLLTSDAFAGCSVVYAIWPDAAAWWEAADFTLRHSDNVLRYDRLYTSLLPFPDGCDVSLSGKVRPAPIPLTGFMRDGLTERRRVMDVGGEPVNVRSALMLEPIRLDTEATTGRRARAHAALEGGSGDAADVDSGSPELWHWGVVQNLNECIASLISDPELDRFRESVADSKGDFLARWYRATDDRIAVPVGSVETWNEGARDRWWLPQEFRDAAFIENLLEVAVRYALAGPPNFSQYLERCRGWEKAGRRKALLSPDLPLVFPLVQNIFVDWLDNLQKRTADRASFQARIQQAQRISFDGGRKGKSKPKICPATQAHWDWSNLKESIAEGKKSLSNLAPEDLAQQLVRALEALSRTQATGPRRSVAADSDEEDKDADQEDVMGSEQACVLAACAMEVLEERLLLVARGRDLQPKLQKFLTWFKLNRSGTKAPGPADGSK